MWYSQELDLAIRLSQEAGAIALKYWHSQNFKVDRKADDSEVTQADKECERMLRDAIAKKYPKDGFLGEEEGESLGKEESRRWIIDPIDGTFNFVMGRCLLRPLCSLFFLTSLLATPLAPP